MCIEGERGHKNKYLLFQTLVCFIKCMLAININQIINENNVKFSHLDYYQGQELVISFFEDLHRCPALPESTN